MYTTILPYELYYYLLASNMRNIFHLLFEVIRNCLKLSKYSCEKNNNNNNNNNRKLPM